MTALRNLSAGSPTQAPASHSATPAASDGERLLAGRLPDWARSPEAISLIDRILADRPDRSKPLTSLATGATASFGFRGRPMAQLRQLYDPYFMDRMARCSAAGHGTQAYLRERDSLIAYDRLNGPDALIERLMACPSGSKA